MSLVSKKIKIKWSTLNKKHFESKGYIYTKIGDEFEVRIEDLSKGSNVYVDVQCDNCKRYLPPIRWPDYLKCVKDDGKYYCNRCNRYNIKTSLRLNSISFEQWCIEHERQDVLERWDYDLNIDKNGNIIKPSDASYGSKGINGKGYWFKCLSHPFHKPEQKDINSFTNGQNGSINCIQCNCISTTHPHILKYLKNKEDGLKYSAYKREPVLLRCPDCGYEKERKIILLIKHGFGCPKCSDGKSYPERFIFSFLEYLNIDFIPQLSRRNMSWCDGYRYDFYIPIFNCIIETHGIQHYQAIKGWTPLKEVQETDNTKEKLSKNNGIV